ncbi:cohesin loading factor-domain-containing protein [Phyllosticta capitalensis]|uniref:Cohesin loading factor-domain-containing protein n=1 Tax=Phyllosticta capitalensis TaxID=121624 RepID=A0ABR1YPI3_9PEZI
MPYPYPPPAGGYPGAPPPQFHPQQRQPHRQNQYAPSSSPPAPLPGTTGAYLAQHQQHQQAYRPAHPMVVIPQRSPSHPHAQPPAQNNAYQQQFGRLPIPPHQYASPQPPMPRPPSRPQHPPSSSPHRPQQSSTPRPRQAVSVQIPASRPAPTQTDYAGLLLSLADEYIRAAHKIAPVVSLSKREKDHERYYALMARGLGCLETVLRKFRLPPRMEGILILKYASLLHEETDNDDVTQEFLSKGIPLCDRNRLLDLKYSMQHLLARSLFKTNHAAAMKSIENVLNTAEMHQHKVWIYAFRFLRASLCMKSGSRGDLITAQNSLRSIATLAESQGDRAIFVTASAMEATVHLRIMAPDSVEQAQRAIASARSLQLELTEAELGFMVPYLDLMDLLCHLQSSKASAAGAKMSSLQGILDNLIQRQDLAESESFSVLIHQSQTGPLTQSTGGIFQKGEGQRDRLTMSWMRRRDLCALGYYLSASTFQLQNPVADRLQKFLEEGLKMSREHLQIPDPALVSLPSAAERVTWHRMLSWYMRVQQTFVACNKCDWKAASDLCKALQSEVDQFPAAVQKPMARFSTYLSGMINQATGNLPKAITCYNALHSNARKEHSPHTDLATLAAINALLILRTPSHPLHYDAAALLRTVEARAEAHPNEAIRAALFLLKATTASSGSLFSSSASSSSTAVAPTAPSVVSMKQNLQHALNASKNAGNSLLLAICITVLAATFFKDIVSAQADKGARNSRQLALRAGNPLWVVVATGLVANTAEKNGNQDQAVAAARDAQERLMALPKAVRESLGFAGAI